MKKVLMGLLLGSLLLCTGCSKELVCTKENEETTTKIVMSFDENEDKSSLVVTEKIDVTKLGSKEQEIDDNYLKEYRKKYASNKDYDNITVSNSGAIITVSYDIVLGSKSDPGNYEKAKDKYKFEGFTCE